MLDTSDFNYVYRYLFSFFYFSQPFIYCCLQSFTITFQICVYCAVFLVFHQVVSILKCSNHSPRFSPLVNYYCQAPLV